MGNALQTVCTTVDHETPAGGNADESAEPLCLSLHAADERDAILELWRSLERELGNSRLTVSSAWTEVWLETFGDLVQHSFAVARRSGQVAGVCLLTEGCAQHDGPLPIRTRHLGTAGEPDADSICVEYNSLLCMASERERFFRLLCHHVEQLPRWDALQLDGFPATDAPAELTTDSRWRTVRKKSWYCDLERARREGCDPVELLGRSMQRQIRRKLRPWTAEQLEWITSLPAGLDAFDELVRLHQQRWTDLGHPGSYASNRFTRFHRRLIERLLPEGRVIVCRLRHNGRTAACSHLLTDQNRVLLYQGGWDPALQQLSPGFAMDVLSLQEAARRNYDAYDFLCGETEHKRRLSTDAAELLWLVRRRPRWRFAVLGAARQTRTALRRWSRSLPWNHSSPAAPPG